ncbi:MAG: HAMP domain-containing protein, partial [Waterburya sp.]
MASGTNYSQEYGQAEKAYLESDFAQAAKIIDHLAEEFPNDPNVLLLRGHIYCYGFQNYDLARQQYENVLELSEEQDLVDFARSGIEQVEQLQQQSESELDFDEDGLELPAMLDSEDIDELEDSIGVDFPEEDFDLGNSYDSKLENTALESNLDQSFIPAEENSFGNPFIDHGEANSENLADEDQGIEDPFTQFDDSHSISSDLSTNRERSAIHNSSTFMVDQDDEDSLPEYREEDFAINQREYENDYDDSSELEIDTVLTEPFSMDGNDAYGMKMEEIPDQEGLDYQDELEFDEIDSSFFDLEELEQGLPDTGLFNVAEDPTKGSLSISNDFIIESDALKPEEIPPSVANSSSTTKTSLMGIKEEPEIEVNQGALAGFINAPIEKKQWMTAGVTGLVSAIAVLLIGLVGSSITASQNPENNFVRGAKNSLILSLVAGVTSLGTAAALGKVTAKHVAKASQDLKTQFDDVYQGNLNAKATVYSQDEFGQLATGFNRMTRVILTTTQEAQRRAEETEQAKEDLQRQVIRLLDDVEGAARGDLTVQATVTADVLGAVADAFNLTIQSLRAIVRQVKEAAEQVNKGSTD